MSGFDLGFYFEHANSEVEMDKFSGGVYKYVLMGTGRTRDQMSSDDLVVSATPKDTPWRVLLVNSRLGGLIESNYLVLNLSAPCAIADPS